MKSWLGKFGAIFGIALVVGLGIFALTRFSSPKGTSDKLTVITTGFVSYDFARAAGGEAVEVKMLLKPGTEAHDFEPTPQDVIEIGRADLLIYNGGESEKWVAELLADNEIPQTKTLRMMDVVELKLEETVEGMETGEEQEEAEYDEHIWTSPVNAIKMIETIEQKLRELAPEHAEIFQQNATDYIGQLKEIDLKLRELVASSTKKELIFGDRFPFRYLVDEYGLEYSAAFPGCSEQTEASSKTIAYLVDKVKKDGIGVVLKIELSNGALAETIAEEAGAKVLTLSAGHNISEEDWQAGVTYLDLWRENLVVLAEALR